MEDTRGGCISHKCELPILHGECGVISLNDSVNSPEDISGHDCEANLGTSIPNFGSTIYLHIDDEKSA